MFDKYIIKAGDTLESISKKFNTSINNIVEINNMTRDMFKEGIEISVLNENDYYTIYKINKGDNLYQIAKLYNINPKLLAALNGLNEDDYIYPNQELLIPKSGFSYYITTEGDTIDLVIDKFNTTKDELLNINKTIYLLPGQLLVNKKM